MFFYLLLTLLFGVSTAEAQTLPCTKSQFTIPISGITFGMSPDQVSKRLKVVLGNSKVSKIGGEFPTFLIEVSKKEGNDFDDIVLMFNKNKLYRATVSYSAEYQAREGGFKPAFLGLLKASTNSYGMRTSVQEGTEAIIATWGPSDSVTFQVRGSTEKKSIALSYICPL